MYMKIDSCYLKSYIRVDDFNISNESFIKKLYEENGFKVIRLIPSIKAFRKVDIPQPIKEVILDVNGIPDFFVIKYTNEYTEWYFLEVKSIGDGLRNNQIKWLGMYGRLPCVILWVTKKSKRLNLNIDLNKDFSFDRFDRSNERSNMMKRLIDTRIGLLLNYHDTGRWEIN